VTDNPSFETIDIFPSKTFKINTNLTQDQEKKMLTILRKHIVVFAWDYKDMKGIHPNICINCIYIKESSRPIIQPQIRMNPSLRDIIKEELQKLLDVGFNYPISDSEWVSPLVIVPKKNEKCRVCIYYRGLNKSTRNDHFPIHFIDQVLDVLVGKISSLF
jgi:hypothetical protein